MLIQLEAETFEGCTEPSSSVYVLKIIYIDNQKENCEINQQELNVLPCLFIKSATVWNKGFNWNLGIIIL